MLDCGKGNSTAKPSKPTLTMDCRVKPGNDDMKFLSHNAIRVGVSSMARRDVLSKSLKLRLCCRETSDRNRVDTRCGRNENRSEISEKIRKR